MIGGEVSNQVSHNCVLYMLPCAHCINCIILIVSKVEHTLYNNYYVNLLISVNCALV